MSAGTETLSSLGTGGRGDRLSFRLVIELLWRCLPLLRPVKRHIAQLLSAVAAMLVIGLPMGLLFFDVLFTRVLQGQPLTAIEASLMFLDVSSASQAGAEGALLEPELRKVVLRRLLFLGAPVMILMTGVTFLLRYYQIWILQRINQELRVRMVDRYQNLSMRYHANNQIGDAIYRLHQDSAMLTQLVDVLFIQPAVAVVKLLGSVVVISLVEPWLGFLLLLAWPPAVLVGMYFSRPMRVGFRAARSANSTLVSRIQETLAGIRVIKAYGAEPHELERFEAASRDAFDAAFAARNRFVVFKTLVFSLGGIVFIAGTGWGAWYAMGGGEIAGAVLVGWLGFTVWNLGLFNWFRDRFGAGTMQVQGIFELWGRIQDIAIGLDRVFDVLDSEPEVQDAPDAVALAHVREGVVFRDVGFAYESDRSTLKRVSFEARVGTVSAIVGPTGSGKSTMMSLLLRLFDPDEGSVEIDGVDIRQFRVESLRARVSIALQENLLFGDTIRENIRYAVPDADDDAVRKAARIACADEFISELPLGYDTMLGERGTKLSTGQRQRLSIARALIKNPAILILDEPTASLDAATELEVLRNLIEWGRDRIILLITHRLSTIRRADRVLVLEAGRVVECGSHDDLLERTGGRYRGLVEAETGPLPHDAKAPRVRDAVKVS